MTNHSEIAEYQTHNVCLWLDNVEHYYLAYIERLERRGLFNASSAKLFVRNLFGDRTPDNVGMSRVHWSEIAECMNSGNEEWIGMRISELKRRNRKVGWYFFSDDTMAYFDSIVYPNTRMISDPENGLNVGVMFVTSERFSEQAPRLYSLRLYNLESNQVDTLGTFQGFTSLERAILAMRRYKLGDDVAAECDPMALNCSPPPIDAVLATLPGIDVNTQVDLLLAELGL